MTLNNLLPWVVAASAGVAAACWWISTVVSVPASEKTSGVGAPIGGHLIVLDAKKKRIDLPATLLKQSRWNKCASIAAGVSAVATGLSAFWPPTP